MSSTGRTDGGPAATRKAAAKAKRGTGKRSPQQRSTPPKQGNGVKPQNPAYMNFEELIPPRTQSCPPEIESQEQQQAAMEAARLLESEKLMAFAVPPPHAYASQPSAAAARSYVTEQQPSTAQQVYIRQQQQQQQQQAIRSQSQAGTNIPSVQPHLAHYQQSQQQVSGSGSYAAGSRLNNRSDSHGSTHPHVDPVSGMMPYAAGSPLASTQPMAGHYPPQVAYTARQDQIPMGYQGGIPIYTNFMGRGPYPQYVGYGMLPPSTMMQSSRQSSSPAFVVPRKREKKVLDIVDPTTGQKIQAEAKEPLKPELPTSQAPQSVSLAVSAPLATESQQTAVEPYNLSQDPTVPGFRRSTVVISTPDGHPVHFKPKLNHDNDAALDAEPTHDQSAASPSVPTLQKSNSAEVEEVVSKDADLLEVASTEVPSSVEDTEATGKTSESVNDEVSEGSPASESLPNGQSHEAEVDDEEEEEEEIEWNVDLDTQSKEEGKRIYSKEFLLRFRELCLKAPKGMPTTDHILALLQDDSSREDSWERPARGHPRTASAGRPPAQTPAAYPPGIASRSGRPPARAGSAPAAGTTGPKVGKSGKPLVRWPIKKTLDKNEEVMKQCKGLLNKLTIENFDSISNKLLNAGITSELLAEVINLIFEKALFEHKYSKMYADLCVMLAKSNSEWKDFKRLLLNRCQEEFERDPEAIKAEWEDLSEEERSEKDFLLRKRMKGNVKFIGELFKAHMLAMEIMYICADMLLQNVTPANLEAVCKLFSTVGKILDVPEPKKRARLDGYFARLSVLSDDMTLESRIRFLLKNLVDLRKNNWVPRMKEEKPSTIKEVHQQAKELEESQMRKNNQRRLGGRGRNDRDRFARPASSLGSGRKTILKGDRNRDNGGKPKFGASSGEWKTVPTVARPPPAKLTSLQNPTSLKPSHSLTGVASPQTVRNTTQPPKLTTKPAKRDKLASNPYKALSSMGSPKREASGPTLLPKKKINSTLEEYYLNEEAEELMLCLEDLALPLKLRPELVGFILFHGAEKNKPQALVTKVISDLLSEKYLSMSHVGDGVPHVLSELEDLSEDMPVAPERVGRLLASLIEKKHLSLPRVKSCLEQEPSLVDAGLAEKLVASLLAGVKAQEGEDSMLKIYHASQFDITEVMSKGTRSSVARQQALLKKHDIECINPILQVSSSLMERLSSNVEDTTAWLKNSLPPAVLSSEEFIRLLTSEILRASVDKNTLENTKDVPTPVELDKEKQQLERFAPLLLAFVDEAKGQLWTLLAVQQFCNSHKFPKGLLERLFNALFEYKVVEAEVFNDWLDNTSEEGKQTALFQSNEWFNWLNKDEEEEELESESTDAEPESDTLESEDASEPE